MPFSQFNVLPHYCGTKYSYFKIQMRWVQKLCLKCKQQLPEGRVKVSRAVSVSTRPVFFYPENAFSNFYFDLSMLYSTMQFHILSRLFQLPLHFFPALNT